MTPYQKRCLQEIYNKYYSNIEEQKPKKECLLCGRVRILGVRGDAKLYCKKCRKKRKAKNG